MPLAAPGLHSGNARSTAAKSSPHHPREPAPPRPDEYVSLDQNFAYLGDTDVERPNPEESSNAVDLRHSEGVETDTEGRAKSLVGVGEFDVFGSRQQPAETFEVTVPGAPPIDFEFTAADPYIDLKVLVVDGDAPAAGATVRGSYGPTVAGIFHGGPTDEDGVFTVRREAQLTCIFSANADRSKVGLTLTGPDETETLVVLTPPATVTGRLVHADDGTPFADEPVRGGLTIKDDDSGLSMNVFGPRVSTNADGRFTATGLVPGWEYWLHLRSRRGNNGYPSIGRLTPAGPETINLGTVRLTKARDLED